MAHIVVWSPRAIDDVAASVVRTILEKARKLPEFPYIGRVVPEFADEAIREVFAYSYRIIYHIEDDDITIAAVVHGKTFVGIGDQTLASQ